MNRETTFSLRLLIVLLAGSMTLATLPAAAASCDAPFDSGHLAPSFGFDFGLLKECVKTAGNPGDANYYQSLTDCVGSAANFWKLGIIAGGAGAQPPANDSCGTAGLPAMPVNGASSPIRVTWTDEQDQYGQERSALRLLTHFNAYDLPAECSDPTRQTWTWLSLQDLWTDNGRIYPPPGDLEQEVDLRFAEYGADSDAYSRMAVSASIYWDHDANASTADRLHLIVMQLYTHPNWADNEPDPDIINVTESATLTNILMDGRFTDPVYSADIAEPARIRIKWHEVFEDLIDRNILQEPPNWNTNDPWEETWTGGVGVLTEVALRAQAPGEPEPNVTSDLTVRDFKIESKRPSLGPLITTAGSCDSTLNNDDNLTLSVWGSGLDVALQLQLYDFEGKKIGSPYARKNEGPVGRNLRYDISQQDINANPAFFRLVGPGGGGSNLWRVPTLGQ